MLKLNKMKKLISVVLAVMMTLSVASVAVSAEEAEITCEHEYGKWIISQDETCTEDGIKYRVCNFIKPYSDFVVLFATRQWENKDKTRE